MVERYHHPVSGSIPSWYPFENMWDFAGCCCHCPWFVQTPSCSPLSCKRMSKPHRRELLLQLLNIKCHFGFTSMEQPIMASTVVCCEGQRISHSDDTILHYGPFMRPSWLQSFGGDKKCCWTYPRIYSTIMSGALKDIYKTTHSLAISNNSLFSFTGYSSIHACFLSFNFPQDSHSVSHFLFGVLTVHFEQPFCFFLSCFLLAFPLNYVDQWEWAINLNGNAAIAFWSVNGCISPGL